MNNYLIQGETLTGIADAIRAKSGSSDAIKVSDFATQIEEIEGGGEEEQPTAVDLLGYDEGVIVETFKDGTTRTSNLEFDSAGNVSKVTADGVETSYSYEFDSEGNVTKISDSNGNATEIIGGDISIGTNVDLVKTTTVLDFSGGDMEVTPNDGEAFSKVSIPKPSTLVAENIVDGVTIAGIKGTHADRELEDKSITLDFSSGDMEVTADDGKAFGSVSIPQPETLLPENIAEGVNIAGIVGTLVAGSGVRFAQGQTAVATLNSTGIVIEHALGIVPDIIIAHSFNAGSFSQNNVSLAVGFSANFVAAVSPTYKQAHAQTNSIDNYFGTRDITTTYGAIHDANGNSFTLGNAKYKLNKATYQWYAIGGLT